MVGGAALRLMPLCCKLTTILPAGSNFNDSAYLASGAAVGTRKDVLSADVVLAVRPPQVNDVENMKAGSSLYSFINPSVNKDLTSVLAEKNVTSFGMEQVPRISRAQVSITCHATSRAHIVQCTRVHLHPSDRRPQAPVECRFTSSLELLFRRYTTRSALWLI